MRATITRLKDEAERMAAEIAALQGELEGSGAKTDRLRSQLKILKLSDGTAYGDRDAYDELLGKHNALAPEHNADVAGLGSLASQCDSLVNEINSKVALYNRMYVY